MPISEVYNMDCLDYMKTIPDKFFDLCIADPPYGINITSGKGWIAKHSSDILGENNRWDKQTPPKEVFEEIFRVSKQQIIWGANYFISKMPHQDTQCWFLWDKKKPDSLSFAQFEMAWSGLKMGCKKFDYMPSMQKNRIHVTQKLVELYNWLLDISKIGGGKIFDPFLGSGSSRIAAYLKGFDFYACEIDPIYFKAQEERFRKECFGEQKLKDGRIVIQESLF